MIPYDYEVKLKLRVIKAILRVGDESSKELWKEVLMVLQDELQPTPKGVDTTRKPMLPWEYIRCVTRKLLSDHPKQGGHNDPDRW